MPLSFMVISTRPFSKAPVGRAKLNTRTAHNLDHLVLFSMLVFGMPCFTALRLALHFLQMYLVCFGKTVGAFLKEV
jgi:hypothetical protein